MRTPFITAFVAVAVLAGGAAAAQPAPSLAPLATPDKFAAEPMPAYETSAPAVGVNASATLGADGVKRIVVANAPVADTPENRAKYGQPLSHAGKRTAARGN